MGADVILSFEGKDAADIRNQLLAMAKMFGAQIPSEDQLSFQFTQPTTQPTQPVKNPEGGPKEKVTKAKDSKKNLAADVAPPTAQEQKVQENKAPTASPELSVLPPTLTSTDVTKAFMELNEKKGFLVASGLLQKLGFENVRSIPESEYANAVKACAAEASV